MHIQGKIKINSISKIKNTKAITKNREEKITFDVSRGLNPHSKGDIKVKLNSVFLETAAPANKTNREIIVENRAIMINL